jgi:hypothetical protein
LGNSPRRPLDSDKGGHRESGIFVSWRASILVPFISSLRVISSTQCDGSAILSRGHQLLRELLKLEHLKRMRDLSDLSDLRVLRDLRDLRDLRVMAFFAPLISRDSEIGERFFAIAQNDNYFTVILNGANAK